MAINPPPPPEDDDLDAPEWVKRLFGRLVDKVEKLEEKIQNVQPPQTRDTEAKPDAGSDRDDQPERKPKRKSHWLFKD